MAYDVIPFKLNAKLRINAAISVEYPAGRTIENYENGTAHMVVSNKYGVLANGEGVDMALGYQSVTITNRTTSILAADTEILIQLDMGETDEATALSAPLILRTRGFLSVEERGVRPVDTAEDAVNQSLGLQAAIDQAIAEKRELILPEGYYGLSTTVGDNTNGISFAMRGLGGGGAKFVATEGFVDGLDDYLLKFSPPSADALDRAVTADIRPGQTTIQMANTTGMQVGMVGSVICDTLWPHDPRGFWFKGETHRIIRVVSSTVIEIAGCTRDFYDISEETVTFRAWRPSSMHFENIGFEFPAIPTAQNNQGRGGLIIDRAYRPTVSKISVYGGGGPGLNLRRCMDGHVDVGTFERIGFETQGYGIGIFGGLNNRLTGIHGYQSRRLMDASWRDAPARDTVVDGFSIDGGGYQADGATAFWPGPADSFGVGNHGPCENLFIRNGKVANLGVGVTVRGRNTTVDNVEFVGRIRTPILYFYSNGLSVRNCKLWRGDFPQAPGNLADGYDYGTEAFIRIGNGSEATRPHYTLPTIITNNELIGLTRGIVELRDAGVVRNLTIRDNIVSAAPTDANPFYTIYATQAPATVAISQIGPNRIRLLENINLLGTTSSNVTLGQADSLYRSVKMNDNTWQMILEDDKAVRIWLSEAGLLPGDPVWISMAGPSAALSGSFLMLPNATSGGGVVGGDVELSLSALNGTIGTDAKVTVSLTNLAVYVENRSGATRTFRLSL